MAATPICRQIFFIPFSSQVVSGHFLKARLQLNGIPLFCTARLLHSEPLTFPSLALIPDLSPNCLNQHGQQLCKIVLPRLRPFRSRYQFNFNATCSWRGSKAAVGWPACVCIHAGNGENRKALSRTEFREHVTGKQWKLGLLRSANAAAARTVQRKKLFVSLALKV